MSPGERLLVRLERERAVAVLRARRYADAHGTTRALVSGGVRMVEITLTSGNALEAIASAAQVDGAIVGAGSVTTPEAARGAVEAGARFLVCPIGAEEVIGAAGAVPVILAGLTPTELWRAWSATGAPVKLFPADVGGLRYLRAVLAPMPALPVMPSGGVSLGNAASWLRAGACAVSVGSALCTGEELEAGWLDGLTDRAVRLRRSLDAA